MYLFSIVAFAHAFPRAAVNRLTAFVGEVEV